MRFALMTFAFISMTVSAHATRIVAAPEIDALAGMAALGFVGAAVAYVWERRKRINH